MSEINKINEQNLDEVNGGAGGSGNWRTVGGLQEGYLAIRTAPYADYNNEINHTGLHNGDQVQVTGAYVQGTGFGGGAATYAWIYSPQYGISGYVNAAYLR